MNVKIVNNSWHQMPSYKTPISDGMDFRANLVNSIAFESVDPVMLPKGLFIESPEGFETEIRRSLVIKHGISVAKNSGYSE
jgi:dUTP pyrophosphatase